MTLRNAHLSAGGDIEKRYAFKRLFSAPAETFGLAGIGDSIYVFKQAGTKALAAPVPQAVTLGVTRTLALRTLELVMPPGVNAVRLVDWDLFENKIYSVIAGNDGKNYHFFGTDYVSEINTLYDPAPHNVRTFKSKMYGVTDDKIVFSALENPMVFDPTNTAGGAVGQGFIHAGNSNGGADRLFGLEIYYDQLAVASRYSTQIWEVDSDPKNNNLRQTLRSAGTLAPPSLLQYGSGDVLYLHDSGIRSLRAKDSSNAAAVSDIGSPIDPIIQHLIKARPDESYTFQAFSLVEPNTGRFWLCFRDKIFILSYYPGPKVTAWSEYVPEFPIDNGIVAEGQVLFRSGSEIYAYGGEDGMSYDDCEVTVEIPFLSVGKPATLKTFTAIDLAAWGLWTVTAGFDPNNPTAQDSVAGITQPTFGLLGSIPLQGVGTHISLTLKNKAPGPATLSAIAVHYQSSGKAD